MKKLLVIFIFFALLISGCEKNSDTDKINSNINLPSVVYTDLGYDIKISLSNNYQFSKSGPNIISGSKWIDSKYLKKGEFYKFYHSDFDNKKVLYYDEVNGRRAALIVYILRNILGYQNVSLGILDYNKFFNCKYCKSLSITGDFRLNLSNGIIGTGKYFLVIDPNKIKFKSNYLLVYVSDLGTMKQDDFYKNFTGNVKNLYWSYLIDIDGKIKSKEDIKKVLKRYDIDFSKYEKVFFYYPKYWRRASVPLLIFSEEG